MGRRSKVTPTHFGRQNQSNPYDFNVLPTTHPFWEGSKTDTIYLENAGNPVCVNIVSDFAARISKLIGQITNIVPARASAWGVPSLHDKAGQTSDPNLKEGGRYIGKI